MPFSTEQNYWKALGLISGAELTRDVSICKGRYHHWPATKTIRLLPVPFQVFVLVLLCFQLQELTSARILGDTEKVKVISVLWKFMLIFGEMTLTVMKSEHSRVVHNITLCGSNLSTVGFGVLGVFWCAGSSLLCVDFL